MERRRWNAIQGCALEEGDDTSGPPLPFSLARSLPPTNLRVVKVLDGALYASDAVDDIRRNAVAFACSDRLLIVGVEDGSVDKLQQVVFDLVELGLAQQLCDSIPVLALHMQG